MGGMRMMFMSSMSSMSTETYTDFYIGYAYYGVEDFDFASVPLIRINSDDLGGMWESGFFSNLNNEASNMEVLNTYEEVLPFDVIQFSKSDGFFKMYVAPNNVSNELQDIVLRVYVDQTPIVQVDNNVWFGYEYVVIPNHMDGDAAKNRAFNSSMDSPDKEYFTVVDDSNNNQTKYTTDQLTATTGTLLEMRGNLNGASNVALISARSESSGERVSLTALSDGRIGLYNNGDGYLYPETEPAGNNLTDFIFASGLLEYKVNSASDDFTEYRSITVTNPEEYSTGFAKSEQTLFETVMDGIIINVPYSADIDYMAVGDYYNTSIENVSVDHGIESGDSEVSFTGTTSNQQDNDSGVGGVPPAF